MDDKMRTRSLATSSSNPGTPEVRERKSSPATGQMRRASVAAAAKVRERIVQLIADLEAEAEREGSSAAAAAAALKVNDVLDARRGKTALHFCAERDEADAVASLLASPTIDVNARRKDGATALFSAAMHGSADCVGLLLGAVTAAGGTAVDVNAARTLDGTTPLCIASQQGHVDVVALLLRESILKLNLCSNNGCSPLFIAAYKNRVEVVRMLLKCKSRGGLDGVLDVNKVEADGCTPLWIAADRGHAHVVEAIVSGPAAARVDINRCDRMGRTPLFMAAFRGHAEIVRMLLESDDAGGGAGGGMIDVNIARSTDGATPLYAACMLGHTDVVEIMLALGNPPRDLFLNLPNHDGATPLGTALVHGHEGIAALLRRAGAMEPAVREADPEQDSWDTRQLGLLALGAGSTRTFKTPSMMEPDAEDMCQCVVQ
jgi:ankyrin repeat protein